MKTVVHKSETRGYYDYGWLKTRHTFSFNRYYNPERMNFGALRVLNDDIVAGGEGFGTHPHDNMEIISIPIKGIMAHKDSTGHEQTIKPGEVQIMSAGTGLTHSEYNFSGDEDLNFLQIWIFPEKRNIKPRYDQKAFPVSGRNNSMLTVVGPEDNATLWINQKAWLSLGHRKEEGHLDYMIRKPGHGVYLFVIEGQVKTGEITLNRRDGAGIYDTDSLDIETAGNTEVVLIEVPMEF